MYRVLLFFAFIIYIITLKLDKFCNQLEIDLKKVNKGE